MVMITLYARLQKRHRRTEESFGLCGRRRAWDALRESCWNMYIIVCESDHQSRLHAWDRVLGAGALGWPRGMGRGGRWEGGFRMGNTCTPEADSCQVWQKPLQHCQVISLCMTGRPGVVPFMGLQRVGHDWVTELNWTELLYNIVLVLPYINMNPTWVLPLTSFKFMLKSPHRETFP